MITESVNTTDRVRKARCVHGYLARYSPACLSLVDHGISGVPGIVLVQPVLELYQFATACPRHTPPLVSLRRKGDYMETYYHSHDLRKV